MTLDNAITNSDLASTALRGLAHASRHLPQPGDSYPVLGDLLAGVGSLKQVVRQLADLHTTHVDRVRTDDGDTAAGRAAAKAAATALRDAAATLRQVQQHLDAASAASSRIVWLPAPHPEIDRSAAPPVGRPVGQQMVRNAPQRPVAGLSGRAL